MPIRISNKHPARLAFIIAWAFLVSPAVAETTNYTPATFKEGDSSLESRIFLPKRSEEVDLTIFCAAVVTVRGWITEHRCNWNRENRPYRPFVIKALDRTQLNPANVDGRNVVAFVKFSIKIVNKDGLSTASVFPHHFLNDKLYGDDYIAAQSYVLGTKAYAKSSRFFGKPWIAGSVPRKCVSRVRVILSMQIDAQGQASDAEIIEKPRPEFCGEVIADAAMRGKYIPALADGKPVPSIYVEKYRTK